jgi:hypothetical protein
LSAESPLFDVAPQDARRHPPDPGEPFWQESFFLCCTDVRSASAFHCHVSLSPFHGKAHVWAWLVVEGREVGRSQEHALPLPSGDLDDFILGGVHFAVGNSMRDLHCTADFGSARISVDYRALTDPVALHYNLGGLKLGGNHYESMGRVLGTIAVGGRSLPFRGGGWQDHSWGIRRLTTNPAGRWMWCVFGDDLAFSIFSLATPSGQVHLGYVLDGGTIHRVDMAACGVTVADDGITPEAADATVWTTDGRGYSLTARVEAAALVGGPAWGSDGNFVWMDGLARFQHAGRVGGGIIEVSNLKTPTAEQRAILNLP